MSEFNFDLEQRKHQEIWRKTNISTSERGFQNKRDYEHIIPRRIWTETLWKDIRNEAPRRKQRGIKIPTAQDKSRSKLRGTNPERD